MCGITGQFCLDGTVPDKDLLEKMSNILAHRGPDGQGMYINGCIALAHRRLAIIDLTSDGCQPMPNEDGTIYLVYNGEIYNYVELRQELAAYGHIFRSHTDSEVILHAYEEWGEGCLTHFNGMWAFAIWDEKKHQLFCARDRFGIKPFYYTEVSGSFLFASEIKALLAHPNVGKKPDDETLLTYLAWGVLDHSEKTMFDGIFQIRPAHAIVIKPGIPLTQYRYWDAIVNPSVKSATLDSDASSRLIDLLRDAVRVHLRSDVAVGTCLSGGIDSSTITFLINELLQIESGTQKTFSVYFDNAQFDERQYIDEVIAATGVDNYRVQPNIGEILDDLNNLIFVQDEPFGSLSIYAQYCVMRLAAEQVKVVMDGQGADELFAGYLGYELSYLRGLYLKHQWYMFLREFIGMIRFHSGFLLDGIIQLQTRAGRRKLLIGKIGKIDRYAGSLDQVLYREMTTNLVSILHYEDRNAMTFSVESRVPFLDYRLVEYISSLPQDNKIRYGITKYLLRKSIHNIVSDGVRCRMDKMGFVTPEEIWMKNELRSFILDVIGSDSFKNRKYWDATGVLEEYHLFLKGERRYSQDLWRFVCTEIWLRIFFDNDMVKV